MKTALISIGYNRLEMQKLSLDSLSRCRKANEADFFVYIDYGVIREKEIRKVLSEYAWKFRTSPRLTIRPKKFGATRNILGAIDEVFSMGYDIVIVVEDDNICSRDFIEYHLYCHTNFDLKKLNVISVTGYIRDSLEIAIKKIKNKHEASCITRAKWYVPDGVSFAKYMWNYIKPYLCEEFYNYPKNNYFMNKFLPKLQEHEPEHIDRWWDLDGFICRFREQDGLLNTVRASRGMYTIFPYVSRVQDIGFYGLNSGPCPRKFDIHNRALWRKSYFYTKCFKQDYSWNKLKLIV